nr:egg cell-secreted protein 1.1-like [Ipomoea batatas]
MAHTATTTTLMIKAVLLLSMAASLATVSARPLLVTSGATALRARLRLYQEDSGGGSSTCWESLFALRACTGEVILFFVNGEKYLGPGCCRSAGTIGVAAGIGALAIGAAGSTVGVTAGIGALAIGAAGSTVAVTAGIGALAIGAAGSTVGVAAGASTAGVAAGVGGGDIRPDIKIRIREHNAVDSNGGVFRFVDQNAVVREESVEKRRGEVFEVGEGESAARDDVVTESGDVIRRIGGHVEREEKLVFGGEESECGAGGDYYGGTESDGGVGGELDLKVRSGDCIAEEIVATGP